MDCSPLGSSVHGIVWARILEWVAMSSSRGSSRPRDWTHILCVSCIVRRVIYRQHHLGSPWGIPQVRGKALAKRLGSRGTVQSCTRRMNCAPEAQVYSLHESQGPGQWRLLKTLGPLSDAYQSPGPQQLTCAVPLHTLGPAIPPSSCRHLQFIHVDHHYLLLELFSLSAASGQYRSFGTLSNCGVRRFTQSPPSWHIVSSKHQGRHLWASAWAQWVEYRVFQEDK